LQIDWLNKEERLTYRANQQMSAEYMGALLIPERELRRQLGILINARFNLQRSINQSGLGEVVDQKFPVFVAIATTGHPANQIVSPGRSKRQNQDKLAILFFSGQLHQYEVRIECLILSLVLCIEANLLRDAPNILALKKGLGILSMVETINFALHTNQGFGIPYVGTQVGGH